MYDSRNNLAQQVQDDARETLGDLVFRTIMPRNVRVSEAPSHALPVLNYDPISKGALAYRALAQEVDAQLSERQEATCSERQTGPGTRPFGTDGRCAHG